MLIVLSHCEMLQEMINIKSCEQILLIFPYLLTINSIHLFRQSYHQYRMVMICDFSSLVLPMITYYHYQSLIQMAFLLQCFEHFGYWIIDIFNSTSNDIMSIHKRKSQHFGLILILLEKVQTILNCILSYCIMIQASSCASSWTFHDGKQSLLVIEIGVAIERHCLMVQSNICHVLYRISICFHSKIVVPSGSSSCHIAQSLE